MHKTRKVRAQKSGQKGGKTIVMGMLERGGEVRTAVLSNRKSSTCSAILTNRCSATTTAKMRRVRRSATLNASTVVRQIVGKRLTWDTLTGQEAV